MLLVVPTVAGARPSAHAGVGLPAPSARGAAVFGKAPLNPAFVRHQKELAEGTLPRRYGGHGLGFTPGPIDFGYLRGDQLKGAERSYPAQYDLRTLGKVSPVGDQYPYGTCWTFATFGSLESCLLPGQSLTFSEDNMVLTNGFDLNSVPSGEDLYYDQGGDCVESTAYLARWSGPVYASEDAYGDHVTPPNLVVRKHVQDVLYLPPRSTNLDNDNIKMALTTYGAVYTDIYADSGMCSSTNSSAYNAANASYYYSAGTEGTNHAVTIVGWDDNYPAGNFSSNGVTDQPPGNGAFIVKNSWGAGWGNTGYFYVSYHDYWIGYDENAVFYDAEPTSNYSHIYQYDPLGMCSQLGGGSPTLWFANVFTAQSSDPLTAVSFYSQTPNSTYEVHTGSSVDGSKTLRASGTLAVPGYHTVSLPAPVALSNGQTFVVFVKITTPGWDYPVAIEVPVVKYGLPYSSAAGADPGQSYVSDDGASGEWIDLTTVGGCGEANVCLKAFTAAAGPSGTMQLNKGAAATNKLTVTANSAVKGAKEMRFKAYNGSAWVYSAWTDYAANATVTIYAPDGTKKVYGYYRDAAGNGFTASDTITLDRVAPSGTMQLNKGAAATNKLTVTANSSVKGAKEMRFRAYNGSAWVYTAWQPYAGKATVTICVPDGTKKVYGYYRDAAGNSFTASDSITLDRVAPSGTMQLNKGAATTSSTTVTANSAVKGATEMRFASYDGATKVYTAWVPYAAKASVTLYAPASTKWVYAYYRDAAGNLFSTSDTIILNTP